MQEGIFLKQDKGGGRQEGGRDPPRSLHLTHEMGKSSLCPLQARGARKGPGPKKAAVGVRRVEGPWGLRMLKATIARCEPQLGLHRRDKGNGPRITRVAPVRADILHPREGAAKDSRRHLPALFPGRHNGWMLGKLETPGVSTV